MGLETNQTVSELQSNLLTGIVLAVQANFYQVQLDSAETDSAVQDSAVPGAEAAPSLLCTRRSRLKKVGQTVMVGDRVVVEEPDWAGNRGAIAHVFPRQSEMDRPAIANINHLLLVFALADPPLEPLQLSRFLVKAESTGLDVTLCLNKRDLLSAEDQAYWCDRLNAWGYEPVLVSVQQEEGMEAVYRALHNRMTLVSGPSGVGKSSLLNGLLPALDLRVGDLSGKLRHGRHTTRHVELFELPSGGFLADSPGFNQPDLACAPGDLAHYFPEARQRMQHGSCQFNDCLHHEEPDCAVRGDWERYGDYLLFLDEAIAHQTVLDRSPDAETTTKRKSGSDGQQADEPKLSPQKYRRTSRRSQKQALQDLLDESELD